MDETPKLYEMSRLFILRNNLVQSRVVSQRMISNTLPADLLKAFCKLQPLTAFQKYNSKRNVDLALKVVNTLIKEHQRTVEGLPNLTSSYESLSMRRVMLSDALTKLEGCLIKHPEATQKLLDTKGEVFSLAYLTNSTSSEQVPIISTFKNIPFDEIEGVDSFVKSIEDAINNFDKQQHVNAHYETTVYKESVDSLVNEARSIVTLRDIFNIKPNDVLLLGVERYNLLRGTLVRSIEEGKHLNFCNKVLEIFEFQQRLLNQYNSILRQVIYCINILSEEGDFDLSDKRHTEAAASDVLYKLHQKIAKGEISAPEKFEEADKQNSDGLKIYSEIIEPESSL